MKICLSCGKEIKDSAAVCRFCGRRTGLRKREYGSFLIVVSLLAAAWIGNKYFASHRIEEERSHFDNELERLTRVERLVRVRLRDPESAIFKHLGSGCGFVNSRNAVGRMGGDIRFIVDPAGGVLLEDDAPQTLGAVWGRRCPK